MMGGVETLSSQVRGVYDQFEPRVPSGIDTCRKDGVITHVHLLNMTVVGNDGTTIVLTGVELHAFRIVLLVVVTIDTLGILLKTTEYVIVYDAFIIILQTTLIDSQRLVTDERGMDEAITQIAVNTIW